VKIEPEVIEALLASQYAGERKAPLLDANRAIHDTVKQVADEGLIAATIDRSSLRAAETPQVFRTEALRKAIESAGAAAATDEAMLVEAAGGRVATVESDQENFKVTTPADLERAAAILSTRP
jgi:2-C-methyl-D-erythritol 4-phosphate cytidylyltransferase